MYGGSLFSRTLGNIERKREKILAGGINSIPWGLPRFEDIIPGIEQRNYYLVSANQKVGKSQLTDTLFMYNAYDFYKKNKESMRLKVFYFSMEMAAEQKMQQAMTNLLFQKHNLRMTTRQLRSAKSALDETVLNKLQDFEEYFSEFESVVDFITDVKHPYGMYMRVKDYMEANGKWVMKQGHNGTQVRDYYVPNDPDEYVIVIFDHASIIQVEAGKSLHQSIQDLSSKYCMDLRNDYSCIPVLVQQQMSAKEDIEHYKLDKIAPTFQGLADNKLTGRDIDVAIGIYTPARYGIQTYLGYDIGFFGDHIRFMEVMGAREGGGGTIIPLFFDGAVTFFRELPKPDDIVNMQKVYDHLELFIRKKESGRRYSPIS